MNRWIKRGPFYVREASGNTVEVRLGNPEGPDGAESEHILLISKDWLADLIAALRATQKP